MRAHLSTRRLYSQKDRYLSALAGAVSDSTHASHKTSVEKFIRWYSGQRSSYIFDETSVAAFITDIHSDYSPTTLRGDIDTLSNFLAYRWGGDPGLMKIRIGRLLQDELKSLPPCIEDIQSPEISADGIETLISYLRQRLFGTRVHAFTEVLLDTKGGLQIIRQLDLDDIDRQAGTAELQISDTHIVGKAGLVTSRIASLSQTAVDALTTYIKHERETVSTASEPLFTTPHGRVSSSAVRYSFAKVSAGAFSQSSASTDRDQTKAVSPNDIRQYSTVAAKR